MKRLRHKWSEPVRFENERGQNWKTERCCVRCPIVRVTRHESNEHWVEFYNGLDRIEGERTPVCEPVEQVAA